LTFKFWGNSSLLFNNKIKIKCVGGGSFGEKGGGKNVTIGGGNENVVRGCIKEIKSLP